MGLVKRAMEEAAERLFWPTCERVCATHVDERYLLTALGGAPPGDECVVCGSSGAETVDLDELTDLVVAALRSNWGRAIDDLFHDPESPSGYAFAGVLDTYDAVVEDLAGAVDDELAVRIAERLDDDGWYRPGDIWLEGQELLSFSWEQFARWVRSNEIDIADIADAPTPRAWLGEQANGIAPSEMMPRLLEVIEDTGLIKELPPSTWHRVSNLEFDEEPSPTRLGTIPIHLAKQPNRFTPAGCAAFYGAANQTTALLETPPEEGRTPVVGAWRPSRALRVIDLAQPPPPPSYWDTERRWLRQALLFLEEFARDARQPVDPTVRTTDYRPTQAVSHAIEAHGGLDGIVYRSSKDENAFCCVLFVDNDHCRAAEAIAPDGSLILNLIAVEEP